MWIMVSGPYASGAASVQDRAKNLSALNCVAYELFQRGHVPIIGVSLALPLIAVAGEHTFDAVMMPLALAVAERCDAVFRTGGPSAGADREVECFRARGLPVYLRLEDVPPASGCG